MSETRDADSSSDGNEHGETAPASLPGLKNLAVTHQMNEAAVNEPKRLREARRTHLVESLRPLASPYFRIEKDTPQYPVPEGAVHPDDVPADTPFFVSLHSAGVLGSSDQLNADSTGLHNVSYQVTTEGTDRYVNQGGLSEQGPGRIMDEHEFSQLPHAIEIRGVLGSEGQQTSMPLGWMVDPSSIIVPEHGEQDPRYKVIGPEDEQFQVFEQLMTTAVRGVEQDPQIPDALPLAAVA